MLMNGATVSLRGTKGENSHCDLLSFRWISFFGEVVDKSFFKHISGSRTANT